MTLRVGIWCAVSSRPQAANDKSSLPDQEAAGYAFAQAIGAQVVAVYTIPGHSRDFVFWHEAEAEMPAYRQVREDLEARRLDVVHTVDSSRLGRDVALVQTFHSLAARYGCEVYDATAPHPIGQQTTGHRYVTAIMAVRAGEEQSIRVHRHRSGMRGRVLRRELHPAHWPIGYTAIRDEHGAVVSAAFDEQVPVVDLVIFLFLAGHSYTEIWRQVQAGPYPPPRSRRWNRSTIRYICYNDAYAGLIVWGETRLAEPSTRFPARWDAITHARIVAERQRRSLHGYTRRGAGPYSGLAFCARCGGRMYRIHDRRWWYWRCSTHSSRAITGVACHSNRIPEHRITSAAAAFLETLSTAEALDAALASIGTNDDAARLAADLVTARRLADELVGQRRRLALAYAAGKMELGIYATADEDITHRLGSEERRATELQLAIAAMPDIATRRAELEHIAADFPAIVERAPPAEVSAILQRAGVRIEIEQHRVISVRLT